MPKHFLTILPLILATSASAADPQPHPWQSLTTPTLAQLTATFPNPPTQNSLSMTWGWAGDLTPAIIASDLDYIQARGVHAVTIECGRITTPNASYLTPGYFNLVKTAVAEAKKRDIHIWFINESKYPSGFAGGKFSTERPDLRMQLLTLGPRFSVAAGQTIDQEVPPETLTAIATTPEKSITLDITAGKLHWTAPPAENAGPAITWQITTIQHIFDTAPTRSSTSPNGAKDKHDSLMDYLNPAATKQFLTWTEEQYKAAVGEEFGKTILGFRGDEPEYPEGAPQPYTPAILAEFQKKKGYDPRPYLPLILAPMPAGGRGGATAGSAASADTTSLQRRVHADYVDVWSDLYRDNYFKQEADWCRANGLEFQVHIDHEERQMSLIRADGDFFKCMRYLQCPGIDTIQNQITPGGPIADFPKFASSAAHLNGNPTAWCEAFAAYQTMNLDICKWVTNYLLVRGINRFEFMFNTSGFGARGARGYLGDPAFPAQAAYVNRASYLLTQGTPAAQIALYCPTSSFWHGDNAAYQNFLNTAQFLLEHQRDCDFVDEQALSSDLKLANGTLVNASGQAYRTIIIPQCTVISQTALDRLQKFAGGGANHGQVIFLGSGPALIAEQNFLHAQPPTPADLSFATRAPLPLTDTLLTDLPTDLQLDQPAPAVKYLHRHLADADLFMLFNESDQPLNRQLTLNLIPSPPITQLQLWDPATGKITPNLPVVKDEAGVFSTPLHLGPYETRFYVVSQTPAK